jgi:hypothetical protein
MCTECSLPCSKQPTTCHWSVVWARWRFIVILPSKLRSSKWFLSFKISQQTLLMFVLSPFRAFRPSFYHHHHHHPWGDHPRTIIIVIITNIIELHKSCYFLLVCSFIHSFSATPFSPNNTASTLFFSTLNVRGQVSHPGRCSESRSFLYF